MSTKLVHFTGHVTLSENDAARNEGDLLAAVQGLVPPGVTIDGISDEGPWRDPDRDLERERTEPVGMDPDA